MPVFKNFNFQLLNLKAFFAWRGGFTLVELLVVLGILSITVGASLMFLTSTLKGSNQANVISEVKQNGQVVLDSLDRQIRNAKDVQCVNSSAAIVDCVTGSPSTKYLGLIMTNGNPLHIKCINDTAGGGKTTDGWIGSVYSADVPSSDLQYSPITNQDTISGVDVVDCNFTVRSASPGSSDPAIVSIAFTINQGVAAPSRRDFMAGVVFQTTISLRKYQ